MRILIVSDDGPNSVGIRILQEAIRANWTSGLDLVTMTTAKQMSGTSFSVTPNGQKRSEPYVSFKSIEPDFYVLDGTPVDCLYSATLWPEHFFGTTGPDLVFTGINYGANVGVDLLHSGTVAVAALAASSFGLPSIAFSQDVEKDAESDGTEALADRLNFRVAEKFTIKVIKSADFAPGVCLNVNFPRIEPKGYAKVAAAPFSRWLPSQWSRPQGKVDRTHDIAKLEDGFISITDVELSISHSMVY